MTTSAPAGASAATRAAVIVPSPERRGRGSRRDPGAPGAGRRRAGPLCSD
ncbi:MULTISPECIES: hypothetical protein [Microbacterium]|nr:hypothetical protein [Microbacterium sp. JZ37]